MVKMNKKAQGMSINTVVLLILAVIVLVVIIAGFTMGWGGMWERVQGFFSKSNVDTVVSTCNIQCTTQQKQEFCCTPKTLRELDSNQKISERQIKCPDISNKIECAGKDTLCSNYPC